MNVSGTREFDAPAQVVWDVINDPARMAKLMPGVESFEIKDERNWQASVKVPLGMGGLKLKMNFEKVEERPIEYARMNAKGNGVGAIISLDTQFHLTAQGDRTSMRWEAEVKIAGPVGSMGARVLQPVVNSQVENVFKALDAQIQEARG